ncbi:MAG: glutamine synthetase [Acidobacteriota bacterium]|nr:glutamine synthetase [Acidobacteriota bacterium]
MQDIIALNPNKLVQYLDKPAEDFTRKDIIKFIEGNGIKMLNFRYIGGDGRLKTLSFVINNKKHLDQILSTGERVDGSSLFSFIGASSSDLYVVPRFKTAFINPFSEAPTLDILCAYYTSEGKPLESSPENIVRKAHKVLKERTGVTMEALGELEFYLFSEVDSIYPIVQQKGYHESHPFSKWGAIRLEAMRLISEMGGQIKYGHAEVGNIIHNNIEMVQHEIEFLPTPVEDAADLLVLAKWVIREVAYKYNLEVSFAPKIIVGHAGSGFHIHTRLVKDNKNMMADKNGLTDTAKKLIAGFLQMAPSLTAFGNTVPTSFLRLVPHQEAPTSICWGDRNRSVLVRVPLGWIGVDNMIKDANPKEQDEAPECMNNQTVELRSPDGSANVHQLLAGMTIAALYGLEQEDSLKIAEQLYVSVDASTRSDLKQLPASCWEAADVLLKDREIYEKYGVFPPGMIDKLAANLKAYKDENMSEKLFGNADALKEMVNKFIHCG